MSKGMIVAITAISTLMVCVVGVAAYTLGRDRGSQVPAATAPSVEPSGAEEPSPVDADPEASGEEVDDTIDSETEAASSPRIAGRSNPNDTPTPKWETGLEIIRDQTDMFDDWSDSDIGRETQMVCERLDTEWIEDIVADMVMTEDPEYGAIISLATNNTCGEHQAEIEAYID